MAEPWKEFQGGAAVEDGPWKKFEADDARGPWADFAPAAAEPDPATPSLQPSVTLPRSIYTGDSTVASQARHWLNPEPEKSGNHPWDDEAIARTKEHYEAAEARARASGRGDSLPGIRAEYKEQMRQLGVSVVAPDDTTGAFTTPLVALADKMPDKQTVRDALDMLGAAGAATGGGMVLRPNPELARVAEEIKSGPTRTPEAVGGTVSGGLRSVAKAGEFMTSPLGVATMGSGLLSKGAQRLITLGFTADMLRHTPELARNFGEATVTGDVEQQTETLGDLLLNSAFIVSGGSHSIGPVTPQKVALSRQLAGELLRSEMAGRTRTEAAAPVEMRREFPQAARDAFTPDEAAPWKEFAPVEPAAPAQPAGTPAPRPGDVARGDAAVGVRVVREAAPAEVSSPFGNDFTPEQLREMATLNAAQQRAKFGTTRAELMEREALRRAESLDEAPVKKESVAPNEAEASGGRDSRAAMVEGPHGGDAASAAAYLRGGGDAVPSLRGGASELRGQAARLQQWARDAGREIDYVPPAREPVSEGAEHQVFFHPDDGRVYKRTYPGSFGSVSTERGLRRTATPYFYLRRLELMNEVFGAEMRLEGVTRGEPPSVVISQPMRRAADPARPLPTPEQVAEFMGRLEFEPVPERPFEWWRKRDGVLVSDARPDNFVLTKEGVAPIDLVVERKAADAPKENPAVKAGDGQAASMDKPLTATAGLAESGPASAETQVVRHFVTSTGQARGGWVVGTVVLDAAGKEVSGPPFQTGIATKAEAKRIAIERNGELNERGQYRAAETAAEVQAEKPQPPVSEQAKPVEPLKATEQKKFLLNELDAALKDALPEAPKVDADADLAILDANRNFRAGDVKSSFDARRERELAPLFEKYQVPEGGPAHEFAKSRSGAPIQPERGAHTYSMDTRFALLEQKIAQARLAQLPKVTIDIPGDGTFAIVNTKKALRDFQQRAKKFPTKATTYSEPSRSRETPAQPPRVETKRTLESDVKALAPMLATDETRAAIQNVYSDGTVLVATDGRQMMVVQRAGPGTPEKPVLLKPDGKPRTEWGVDEKGKARSEPQYPNYKQVIPRDDSMRPLYSQVETGRVFSLLKQALAVLDTEKSATVYLHVDKAGRLGITAETPAVGEYASGITDTSRPVIALNGEYLLEAIASARRLGSDKVEFRYIDELAPITMEGEGFKYILMPMRMEGGRGYGAETMAKAAWSNGAGARADAVRAARGSEAMPAQSEFGRDLPPPEEPPRAPRRPKPEDDPEFTALPINLAEGVRFARDLLDGKYPKVREKLGALGGSAAGVFSHTDGPHGRGEIKLRADQADLLSPDEKAKLRQEAAAYARQHADPHEFAKVAAARYEFLEKAAYDEAKKHPPKMALRVLWHEIGHAVDWLPDKMIQGRGNLFGRIASLKNYLRHTLERDPNKMGPFQEKPSPKEMREMRDEAIAQLREEMGPIKEIIEEIWVEEPQLRVVGVKPQDILDLMSTKDMRAEQPELYRWFAEQSRAVKAEILKKAMRGVLDERLAKLGKSEVVGVNRVKRTVRQKVGREPSQEEIRARFQEIFEGELRRRNLAELETVKAELRGAIAWYEGVEKMPEYFEKSSEMYAHAFSIFLNNPAALQKRAPTFSRLFWNYLDRKPEVKKLYDQIQNEIKAGQVEDVTEAQMLTSWDAAEQRAMERAENASQRSAGDFLDSVLYHMDRRFGPIYRAAKGYAGEGRLREALGSFLYRQTDHELFLGRMNRQVGERLVAANLDWKDLGRFLFYDRVQGERYKIFNPYGVAPDRALNRLQAMRESFGPERFAALERAAQEFHALYDQHVATLLRREGMFSPELQEVIDRNVHYATFEVQREGASADGIARMLESAYGPNVGPHIYRQIGTVGEIRNPATATVLKALSLMSAARRNAAKRETVRMLREHDPVNIVEAQRRWTGKKWEYIVKESEQVGTVIYMSQGKPQAFYVRKVVADALNKSSGIENALMVKAVEATGWLKGILTQLNYAFWPVNFMRDTAGWVMQVPGATPVAWAKHLPQAVKAARASVKGRANPHAEAALARKMVISRADPRGTWAATENAYEARLASYGLNPAQWAKEADRVHALVKVWNSYREAGQTFERVNKIAGMLHLDEKFPQMPEWKKREIVRERAGSPDFLQRGASNPYVDFLMMFYNPWKEGVRSVAKSARENPWSFAAKSTALIVVPSVVQALANSGAFGDETEEMMRSIPDYDAGNYLVVPLGWSNKEQKTVTYLRLPLWEPARLLHGAVFNSLTGRGPGIVEHVANTVPSMNALLGVASDWIDYEFLGRNPRDRFRGKNLLSDAEFAAKGWPARRELLKNSWNQMGGSVLFRFRDKQLEAAPETEVQEFLRLPVVNNALGRWVKVSNAGRADEARQVTEPVERERAVLRLAGQEMARKLVDGEAFTSAERELFQRDDYVKTYTLGRAKEILRARSSPLLRQLQGAPSRASRDALLMHELER